MFFLITISVGLDFETTFEPEYEDSGYNRICAPPQASKVKINKK